MRQNSKIIIAEEACAKLVTEEKREFYIKEGIKEITLGREKNQDTFNYFQIGETNTISKKHARIFWDNDAKCWKIQNLSKNKVSLVL